jgi:hypothetical protein
MQWRWIVGNSWRGNRLTYGGKVNPEVAALPDAAFNVHPTMVLLNDSADRSQTQPYALANVLRCKKWLEQPLDDSFVHTATSVGDGQAQIPPRPRTVMSLRLSSANPGLLQTNPKQPSIVHCVPRIEAQVQEHSLHHDLVGIYPR